MSINPPENVMPTPTFKMCISIYANPANIQCTAYKSGATNKNVNSSGSVIPVIMEVSAADAKSPATASFFSGFATLYIASAAPGSPKIINGNLPDIKRVADTAKWEMDGSASWAKNIFWAPSMTCPPTSIVPPSAVCQNGR